MKKFVEVKDLKKEYGNSEVKTIALSGINLEIDEGEFVVIAGASGSGKTTLLNIIGGMDSATYGSVIVDGEDISKYSERKLTEYRRNKTGFVFQFYNLVQNLTVKENVELATVICKKPLDILDIIKSVGLEHRIDNFPAQLSGGEQQRVAIARAVAKNPRLLLCDEPTGALDYNTGKSVLKLLHDICKNNNVTVILITHNLAITKMADKIIKIKNGLIDSIEINKNIIPIERIEW